VSREEKEWGKRTLSELDGAGIWNLLQVGACRIVVSGKPVEI
jgi:hypothetical protein